MPINLKKIVSIVILMFCTTQLFSQVVKLSGNITDKETGKPIGNVYIKVKNGTNFTETDTLGYYSIDVPSSESILTISMVGYRIYEVKAGSGPTLDIPLTPFNDNNLNEVVVVGYGTQSKRDITGSMATIDFKKIADMPVASISDALRGQVPGLNVTGGGQRPGTMASINVRQQFNFAKDGGGTVPLVVIDDIIQVDPSTGQPTLERFNQLDLSEVESITVVKDAAAAIYGSRGSQGVIVVKTKRGKPGPPKVTYSAKFERNDAVSHGKVMNARQYGDYSNKMVRALGQNVNYLYSDAELSSMDSLNYDWLGNAWKPANAMQHSIDVSGGAERATYFMGVSYYTQGANMGEQDFKRWTYRAGGDIKVANGLRLAATIAASNTSLEQSFTKVSFTDGFSPGGEQNDYSVLLHMPKYIPWIYNINGVDQYISPPLASSKLGSASGNNSLSNYNYFAMLNNGSKTFNDQFNYNVNINLQYDVPFIKGLSFKYTYGQSQSSSKNEQDYFPQLLYQASTITTAGKHLFSETAQSDFTSTLNRSNTRVTYDNLTSKNYQTNFFIMYDHQFGDHSISAMGSFEKAKNTSDDRYQIYDNPQPNVYNGTSTTALGTINASNSLTSRFEGGTMSYLGRVSYNYKSRYLLQFVFRSDASTNFAPENYWNFLPAVSAGWIISDEDFFKNNSKLSWINFLKIRANIGRTGNNNTRPWQWAQLFDIAQDKGFGFGANGGLYVVGLTPGVTANRAVTWDKTLQRNFGIDMSFLNRRLSVTFDQYFNTSTRMLTTPGTTIGFPITVGGAMASINYTGTNWWGSELSLNWKDNIKDFSYSIGINTTLADYKVTKYFDQAFNYPSITTSRSAVGNGPYYPVWGFRTWKETSGGDGMLRTDDDINNYWNYLSANASNSGVAGAAPNFLGITSKSGLKKGMLVYEDAAGNLNTADNTIAGPNGRIAADEDYVKIKKSNRSYGFVSNISLGWKGISLMTQIATSWGGSNTLDYVKQGTSSTNAMWSQPIYLTDMYDSTTNPNGKYPSLAYYDAFGGTNSDFFQISTFRMVIRTLSIGYTLPRDWVQSAKIQSARIFLSGNNLWDLYNPYPKKYRNMYDDPKVGYPTLRTWALGVNIGF